MTRKPYPSLAQDFAIHNGIKAFADVGVDVVESQRIPGLALLKYNQLVADMSNPVIQECRGIVLDQADNFRPVCFPYSKFFNYGEQHAAKIDWKTALVMEKLDGSLLNMWQCPRTKKYVVSTTGSPDASGNVGDNKRTFAQLFWETFSRLGYKLPGDSNWTFMFELCTPLNQVVVRYPTPEIRLHGVRCNMSGQEIDPFLTANMCGWKSVRVFPWMESLEHCLQATKDQKGTEIEGFVVRDREFQRIKIKNEDYVKLHHLRSAVSVNKFYDLVRSGEWVEFVSYFPQYTDLLHKIHAADIKKGLEIVEAYNQIKGIETQKDFATQALGYSFSDALFTLRRGEKSLEDWIRSISLQRYIRLLDINIDLSLDTE